MTKLIDRGMRESTDEARPPPMQRRTCSHWAFLVLIAPALACGESPTEVQTLPPVGFRVSGDQQVQFPRTVLPQLLTVQLLDGNGDASQTSSVPVNWTVLEGGGAVEQPADTTTSVGQARTSYELGPDQGLNRVRVEVRSFAPFVFTATAVRPGPIAFSSNRRTLATTPEPSDVFVMEVDGSNVVKLSPHNRPADWLAEPSWSPDGRFIAYARYKVGFGVSLLVDNVYVIEVNRHEETAVPNAPFDDPSWSPTGRRLAVVSRNQEGGSQALYVINAWDDVYTRQISSEPGVAPDWSPDGHRIVFARVGSSGSQICTVGAGGGYAYCLTDGQTTDIDPVWSPDGTRILFARDAEQGGGIWVMNADGTGQEQVLEGSATSPSWSPDGTAFVVCINVNSQRDIFHVDLGTGELTDLTLGVGQNWDPAWRW